MESGDITIRAALITMIGISLAFPFCSFSITLGPTNLGHNKFGNFNFGYHNFSYKFRKFLVYNNFSHIVWLFETIFHFIYLIFPLFS